MNETAVGMGGGKGGVYWGGGGFKSKREKVLSFAAHIHVTNAALEHWKRGEKVWFFGESLRVKEIISKLW